MPHEFAHEEQWIDLHQRISLWC